MVNVVSPSNRCVLPKWLEGTNTAVHNPASRIIQWWTCSILLNNEETLRLFVNVLKDVVVFCARTAT